MAIIWKTMPPQHDSATHRWVLMVTSGSGGDGTTNALNGERDDISSEEDDGIHLRL